MSIEHKVTLSNGEVVVLKECDGELAVYNEEACGTPWWVLTITPNGVLVSHNSGGAPEAMTAGLKEEPEDSGGGTCGRAPEADYTIGCPGCFDQEHADEKPEGLVESDVEWTGRIAQLVRNQGEVEEIETNSDSPERIAKNEFFFYTKYSDKWPAFRVVVEPVAGANQKQLELQTQFQVVWCQIPTNYHPRRMMVIEARNADVARAFVKDQIERETGLGRSEFVIISVAKYDPPEPARVISG